jgi:hypothetical protein
LTSTGARGLAGEFAGIKLNDLGFKPTLCVGQGQGQVQLEERCAGIASKFTNDLVPPLQNGKVAFIIDQKPYLQGYMSIESLWLYKQNKIVMGAQQSVPTSPVVIDQKQHRRHQRGRRRTALIRTPSERPPRRSAADARVLSPRASPGRPARPSRVMPGRAMTAGVR